MTGRPPSEGTALTKALAGATCAIAEAVLITPLEVAKVLSLALVAARA